MFKKKFVSKLETKTNEYQKQFMNCYSVNRILDRIRNIEI